MKQNLSQQHSHNKIIAIFVTYHSPERHRDRKAFILNYSSNICNIADSNTMKKFLSILLIATGMAGMAQDRLEPYRERTKEDGLTSVFYEQELWRLLNPDNAEWGVLRDIELMAESSLTYDAETHSLVYTEIDGILWSIVRDAASKRIEKGNHVWFKDRKKVKRSYKAPDTKSISLAIPDGIASKLKALWLSAVNTPAKNDLFLLGGVTFTYFADGKKAEGKGGKIRDWIRVPRLFALASNLIKAVQEQDSEMLLQLEPEIDELYKLFLNEQ